MSARSTGTANNSRTITEDHERETPTGLDVLGEGPKLLSIIVPVFNEEESLDALMERLVPVVDSLESRFRVELLFVDDGSVDRSFAVLERIAATNDRVRALRLSRNFGSHLAITAGLEDARGDAAIILPADLQEPPESIPEFVREWEAGHEIVWGIRAKRADRRSSDALFSRFFTALTRSGEAMSGYPREGPSAFMLVDRAVIEAIRGFHERNRMILGMIAWTGFNGTTIEYEQVPRNAGTSGWSLARKIKLTIDALVSFSYAPIRVASLIGVLLAFAAFVFAGVTVVLAIAGVMTVAGFPTLLAVILFLGGLQMLFLGILGEYLWRALDEARARPTYIVRDRL